MLGGPDDLPHTHTQHHTPTVQCNIIVLGLAFVSSISFTWMGFSFGRRRRVCTARANSYYILSFVCALVDIYEWLECQHRLMLSRPLTEDITGEGSLIHSTVHTPRCCCWNDPRYSRLRWASLRRLLYWLFQRHDDIVKSHLHHKFSLRVVQTRWFRVLPLPHNIAPNI